MQKYSYFYLIWCENILFFNIGKFWGEADQRRVVSSVKQIPLFKSVNFSLHLFLKVFWVFPSFSAFFRRFLHFASLSTVSLFLWRFYFNTMLELVFFLPNVHFISYISQNALYSCWRQLQAIGSVLFRYLSSSKSSINLFQILYQYFLIISLLFL